VFDGSGPSDSLHVGIVVRVQSDGEITTVEGNYAGQVSRVGPFAPSHQSESAPALRLRPATRSRPAEGVRIVWPGASRQPGKILDLFAGAVGGGPADARPERPRIETESWACETARAAGYERLQADVAKLDPRELSPVWGLVAPRYARRTPRQARPGPGG
jgi:hypothetical protein